MSTDININFSISKDTIGALSILLSTLVDAVNSGQTGAIVNNNSDAAADKAAADADTKKAKAAAAKAKRETAATKRVEADAKDDPEENSDDAGSKPENDLAAVRLKLKEYAGIEGMPAAKALLEKYEAKNITDLKPSKYDELVKDCG